MKRVATYQAVQFMDTRARAIGLLMPSRNPHHVADWLADEIARRGLGKVIDTGDPGDTGGGEDTDPPQVGADVGEAIASSDRDAAEAKPLVQVMLSLDASTDANWTEGGKPQLKPLTQAMKRPVDAAERDEAWEIAEPMRSGLV